jgi:hypothetical protein
MERGILANLALPGAELAVLVTPNAAPVGFASAGSYAAADCRRRVGCSGIGAVSALTRL